MESVLRSRDRVEIVDGEIRWWTFAGGRINATLRYALESLSRGWKVIPDNFAIKVRGEQLTIDAFREALLALADVELWENDTLWTTVAASLPNYRLSKFQPLMPPWVEREVVASYLLDVGGAWKWMAGTASRAQPRAREHSHDHARRRSAPGGARRDAARSAAAREGSLAPAGVGPKPARAGAGGRGAPDGRRDRSRRRDDDSARERCA